MWLHGEFNTFITVKHLLNVYYYDREPWTAAISTSITKLNCHEEEAFQAELQVRKHAATMLDDSVSMQKNGQVRSRTEDLSHAKGARYQLRHMPVFGIKLDDSQ